MLAQADDAFVQAELEDVVDFGPGLALDVLEGVDVPGVEHDGFFADDGGALAEAKADVGVVEVVGGAHAEVVHGGPLAAQLVEVAVEALELDEEVGLGEVAVDDAHGVVGVVGGQELVAGIFDGFHVARGYEAGGADEGEVFHA